VVIIESTVRNMNRLDTDLSLSVHLTTLMFPRKWRHLKSGVHWSWLRGPLRKERTHDVVTIF
jgi:hypothetical protein